MSLVISPSTADKLPGSVRTALSKLSDEHQMQFQEEFNRKSKSTGLMMALAILFPIQLFLLDKTGLGILFIFTIGGFFIWWIVEIFLTPSRVRDFNSDLATKQLTELKIMNS